MNDCYPSFNELYYRMSKSKDGRRPNLFIEIEDFQRKIENFKQGEIRNNVALKPLRSAKNIHEVNHFNFEENNADRLSTERKLQKLHQLQQQKYNLMHSLEVLKQSAVSAIAEKEDEIERLRTFDHFNIQEKLEFYESELHRSQRLRLELEEEKQQLCQEFREQRSKYTSQLQEKQYLIEQLQEEITDIRKDLEVLELNDMMKSKHIKLLQQENSKLSVELQEISLSNSLREITDKMDLDETVKFGVGSVVSSIHSQNYLSYIESNEHIALEGGDRSYFSEKLQEMNRLHKEDVIELKNFYEKRIAALREIYERELNLPTQESEKSESLCRSRNQSKKSLRRSPSERKSNNYHNTDHGLNLNLRDMYSIEEHAEQMLETERKRYDLKYEIKMQNLSECPSVEPRIRTQEDMGETESVNSQFTAKYFQNPFRFMKKNKSASTFNREETRTILKIKREESTSDLEHVQEVPETKSIDDNFWNKTKVFAAGVFSGVTLTTLATILFKRN